MIGNGNQSTHEIKTDTVMKILIGIEWLKSSWFKSQIKSQTLKNVKDDSLKYLQCIDKKIKSMSLPKYAYGISPEGNKEWYDENELYNIMDGMNDEIDECMNILNEE